MQLQVQWLILKTLLAVMVWCAVSTTATLGQVSIDDDGSTVTITTCFEDGCASDAVSTNTVAIE